MIPDHPRVQQVLTCSRENVRLEAWNVEGHDGGVAWWIDKQTLRGGRQEGVDVIEVDNGVLRFRIVPTRGMSILEVEHAGLRFGWRSPVEEIIHPSTIDLASRGGLGWLEGFNEWLVRCGLEWAGAPGKDAFITNTGARAEMDLTLHGRIANLPASRVEVVVTESDPPRIEVRGIVHERLFYGPRLELRTVISTEVGSDRLIIEDRVSNHGGQEQEYQLLYHVNTGAPLIEAGARFFAPLGRVTPVNAHAAAAVDRFDIFEGPAPGFIEEVFCLQPFADSEGCVPTLLSNAAGNRGVLMRQRSDELSCITLWKSTADLADGYVVGIEPGTSYPLGRGIERRHGRVPVLGPGIGRDHRLEFRFLNGVSAVAKSLAEIQSIQAERSTVIDRAPAG